MRLIRTYLLLTALFFCAHTSAQDLTLDSLKSVLASNVADTAKVLTHIEVAKYYRGDSAELLLDHSKRALALAEDEEYTAGIALAYKWYGFYYYDKGSYVEAQDLWLKSLEAYEKARDLDGQANILNNLGSIYFNNGNYAKALEYFLPAYQVAEKGGYKLRIATAVGNIGLIYMEKPGTYPQALEYLNKALKMAEELEDQDNIAATNFNIGEIHMNMNKDSLALDHFFKAMRAMESSGHPNVSSVYNYIARVYIKEGNNNEAYQWLNKAYTKAKEVDNTYILSQTCLALGDYYKSIGNMERSIEFFAKAREYAEKTNAGLEMKQSYKGLASAYAELNDFRQAYNFELNYSKMTDSLSAFQSDSLQSQMEMGIKENEIKLLNQDKALQDVEIKRQKLVRNAILIGFALVVALIVILYRDYKHKIQTNKLLDQRKAEIETLLLNILPFEVAEELQKTGKSNPRFYESTTVMFTDFVGFSRIAETLTPQQVTAELNEFFTEMDEIIDRYGIEKIKTIGDSYMCAGGIPTPNTTHPLDVVRAGLDIVEFLRKKNKAREDAGLAKWEIRIGLNTGSLVAGVVGKKKYAYDIWGSAVNIASRMESNGSPGVLNISASTYELIKDKFECEYRGKIYAKNVGEIDMYFVKRELSNGNLKAHTGEPVSSKQ